MYLKFKIVKDLAFFVIVILIVSFGSGVCLVALVSRSQLNGFKVVFDVISAAYWPVFGENNFLDILRDKLGTEYTSTGAVVAFFVFMIYVLEVILLINLLIAMFKYDTLI